MADTVRYLMEEMIPELEDLETKGYFSRREIKAIVQRRQDFEYALKRRAALKRDFLRSTPGKSGLAEMSMTRRIHFIYERATRKFKADLSLWLAWLQYCKRVKSTKQLSKVVTKALQRHSHVPLLWIEAAVWEFEHTGNVAAARTLMQHGLRSCKGDEGMWSEYVRLEMMYVARLRARRAVLGLENPGMETAAGMGLDDPSRSNTPAAKPRLDKAARRAARKAAARAASADVDTAEGATADAAAEAASVTGDAAAAVLTGAVVKAVLRAALAAIPHSLDFRRRLLRVLLQFQFPGAAQLAGFLMELLRREAAFESSEGAWDLRALWHWPQGLSAHLHHWLVQDQQQQQQGVAGHSLLSVPPSLQPHSLDRSEARPTGGTAAGADGVAELLADPFGLAGVPGAAVQEEGVEPEEVAELRVFQPWVWSADSVALASPLLAQQAAEAPHAAAAGSAGEAPGVHAPPQAPQPEPALPGSAPRSRRRVGGPGHHVAGGEAQGAADGAAVGAAAAAGVASSGAGVGRKRAHPAASTPDHAAADLGASDGPSQRLLPGHLACCRVYEAALAQAGTPRMHSLYAAYLAHRLQPLLAAAPHLPPSPLAALAGSEDVAEAVAVVGSELLALCQRAVSSKAASEQLCSYYVAWASALGQVKLARKAAKAACSLWPASAMVWRCRLALELQRLPATQQPAASPADTGAAAQVFEVLAAALQAVPVPTQGVGAGFTLWAQALAAMSPAWFPAEFQQLQQLLLDRVMRHPGKGPVHGGLGAVAAQVLVQVRQVQGLSAARQWVHRVLQVPPPGADFFRAAIAMELEELQHGGAAAQGGVRGAPQPPQKDKHVRQVFEAAVAAYGSEEEEFWLQYALHEARGLRGMGPVYWRAVKSLADPDGFVERFRAAQNLDEGA